jgi:hypothetical protein
VLMGRRDGPGHRGHELGALAERQSLATDGSGQVFVGALPPGRSV